MPRSNRERIAAALTALAETYRQELSAQALALVIEAVEDLGPEAVSAACRRAVRERKWMPTASELRELAGEVSGTQAAELAWGDVLRAMAGQLAWSDLEADARRALAAIGGSYTVRHADSAGLAIARKSFMEAFGSEAHDAAVAALPAPARGALRDVGPVVAGLVEAKTMGGRR